MLAKANKITIKIQDIYVCQRTGHENTGPHINITNTRQQQPRHFCHNHINNMRFLGHTPLTVRGRSQEVTSPSTTASSVFGSMSFVVQFFFLTTDNNKHRKCRTLGNPTDPHSSMHTIQSQTFGCMFDK